MTDRRRLACLGASFLVGGIFFVNGVDTRAGEFLVRVLLVPIASVGVGFFVWLGRSRPGL